MCGITGILGPGARDPDLLARMSGRLAHRGPDDEGLWSDGEAGVALAHRRLAIVDLTAAGHEPMHSASGRLAIDFNGEIYNHAAIRAALEGEGRAPEGGWRGHNDAETFLEAIEHWGLERALDAAVGMFAFALWDRKERTLRLVRDRFGEKPLYYGWAGKDFLFASELKAMALHPDFDRTIDRQALGQYSARCYIPAPRSIYEAAAKLEPGCILTLAAGAGPEGVRIARYYDYRTVVEQGNREQYASEAEALEAMDEALSAAIDGQLMADVPVGAFLSGGIDSSTICALYQRQSNIPIRTFSIGFEQDRFNEAKHAKAVASHLGTVHHEHYVSVEEARDVIPMLPQIYDEPFADSSQIPTFLVSRFARQSVTVALTGDGGDELFGGYNRHIYAPALWRWMKRAPMPVRKAGGAALSRLPDSLWSGAAGMLKGRRQPGFGAKVRKGLALAATAGSLDDIYESFLDEWAFRAPAVAGNTEGVPGPKLDPALPELTRLTCYDSLTYLPDDILCKVDRASMAVSLETRVPFLDHRVAAVAARVPPEAKVKGGTGKQILRDYLDRFVPRELVDRPKAGFAIPIGGWLRGPLREWAEELLSPQSLREQGFYDAAVVGARWKEHLAGGEGSTQAIWSILMFQSWLRASCEVSQPQS
jgi:asparagine synthase (glutamine-hydrolysing)